MKRFTKILLALAVTGLFIGAVVSFSGIKFPPEWTVAFPSGVILLGLFMISWHLRKEVAKYDVEHNSKIQSVLHDKTSPNEPSVLEEEYSAHFPAITAGHSC